MMESPQEEGPESEAPRPFGAGIPLPTSQGPRAAAAKGPRRPVTFTCALGRRWSRAVAADLDEALAELMARPGKDDGSRLARELGAALSQLQIPALAELLGSFSEESSQRAARDHFAPPARIGLATAASSEGASPWELGPETEAVLLRPHRSGPFADFCLRVVELLQSGRPVIVLSDPTLPLLAEAAVEWVLSAVPDAPLRLLHEDGLEVLRRAAALPNLALEIAEPEAGLKAYVTSLRKTRGDLVRKQAEKAAAETAARERDGWFGSGVVSAPLAPLWVRSSPSAPWEVPPDAVPAEAAEQIVRRAFGPSVLGGFAAAALTRVCIPPLLFSSVSQEVLARLAGVEDDAACDPPSWVLDAPVPSDTLFPAKRLGLDEGATLIFERQSAREDDKAYGLVFTNGEPRMRTGDSGRAMGVLLLMRSPN